MKPSICIYCGRSLKVTKKGNMPSHVTAGNMKCIAIGSKAAQHDNYHKQLRGRA